MENEPMTNNQHRATPEQWALVKQFGHHPQQSLILELADRLAAAEQRIGELESAENYRQQDEDAERAFGSISGRTVPPPLSGSLVAKVTDAVVYGLEISDQRGAIDAILAVAEWLDSDAVPQRFPLTARCLRKEVERHG